MSPLHWIAVLTANRPIIQVRAKGCKKQQCNLRVAIIPSVQPIAWAPALVGYLHTRRRSTVISFGWAALTMSSDPMWPGPSPAPGQQGGMGATWQIIDLSIRLIPPSHAHINPSSDSSSWEAVLRIQMSCSCSLFLTHTSLSLSRSISLLCLLLRSVS